MKVIRLTITRMVSLALIALAVVAAPALAGEVRFTQSNDFLVGNKIKDDLYTFSAAFAFTHDRFEINIFENAFTDRRQQLRFDETYLTVSQGYLLPGWFELDWELGGVHVGRGLLGDRAQNALHRIIGDNEVHLPYLDQNKIHALIGFTIQRDLQLANRSWLQSELKTQAAFGFRTEAAVKTRVLWRRTSNFSLFAGPGFRYVDSDLEPLDMRLKPRAGTWEAGFELYSNWRVMWSHNDYGTGNRHLVIDYIWRPKRAMPSQDKKR